MAEGAEGAEAGSAPEVEKVSDWKIKSSSATTKLLQLFVQLVLTPS